MNADEFFDKLYPNYPDDYKEEWVQKRGLWREKTIKDMEAFLAHKIKEARNKLDIRVSNNGIFIDGYKEALNKLKEL